LTTGPNAFPGATDSSFNSGREGTGGAKYSFVGEDFANWKAYTVEVAGNVCTSCHRMGMNNITGGGTARNFGPLSTAPSGTERNKNPHSAASPIWMPPNNTLHSPANAAAAEAIRACAAQFRPNQPLPDSNDCRIKLFAEAYTGGGPVLPTPGEGMSGILHIIKRIPPAAVAPASPPAAAVPPASIEQQIRDIFR
jgi:hypothetical protein